MDELFDLIVTMVLTKSNVTAEKNLKKYKEITCSSKNALEEIKEELNNSDPQKNEEVNDFF